MKRNTRPEQPLVDELGRLVTGFEDHFAFCRASLKVRNKAGQIIPFEPSPGQIKLRKAIAEQRRRHRPVRIVYLKPRQAFISTGTASEMFRETPFQAGQHTLVVAHDKAAAENIWGYYHLFQEQYEPFGSETLGKILLPRLKANAKGHLEWHNGSWIRVASADNVQTGRSFTVQRLHLSEFAFYRDARTLMGSLMQMVPDSPDSMVVVETTANGVGNEFYELWHRACNPLSRSEWLAVFLAWWEHPEYRRAIDGPRDKFQASLDKEERELMGQYSLSLEQLTWRRWKIETDLRGDIELFRQEYPSSPEEAFRTSGRSVFSFQHLERMPVIRDAAIGRLEEELLGSARRISFQLVERGELTVYRKPERGHLYAIGADTAEGIDAGEGTGAADPDYSVGQVLDINSGEQVAKFRARVAPAYFGSYLCTMARWYEWAFLCVEVDGVGLATMEEILRQGYPLAMLYHRPATADDLTRVSSQTAIGRVGWKTTTVTREQLVSKVERAIREMSIVIRDPGTIQECRTFIVHPDGRKAAQKRCHDDEVFALGLAIVGLENFPRSTREAPTPREQLKVSRYGQPEAEPQRGRLFRF